jgi:hypothetical protein
MGLLDQIRASRRAHEGLRSSPPARPNLAQKSDHYRAVKAVLDQLWVAADQPEPVVPPTDVRRAVRRLTADAEYFAGLSDAEGLRDPAEMMAEYDLLERAFAAGG